MKIISGQFKGQNLNSFQNKHIRPTMSKVKESLFNKIQFQVGGAKVLDLFSGTGSLGIEAISRGAIFVDFVEKHSSSLKILKSNIKLVKVESCVQVFQDDVFTFLKRTNPICNWNIVLIDPPFTQQLADSVMDSITRLNFTNPEAIIIIESTKHEVIKPQYLNWSIKDQKNFGDKKLSFFTRVL